MSLYLTLVSCLPLQCPALLSATGDVEVDDAVDNPEITGVKEYGVVGFLSWILASSEMRPSC